MKIPRFTVFITFLVSLLLITALSLWVVTALADSLSIITRISVASNGAQATGGRSYNPDLSTDGRYVAFDSEANNLVPGDTNNRTDVFVRDRQTGQTTRISVATNGTQANGKSDNPAISANGRYVAFASEATNLVANDTNWIAEDVFVHDRDTDNDGVFDEPGAINTNLVSLTPNGTQATIGSLSPAISANGRYVAFVSLVDVYGNSYVYVRDRQTGQTSLVSASTGGAPGNDSSYNPALSADGRYVVFESAANNLVYDTNGAPDVFVRDRDTDGDHTFDEPGAVQTRRVSVASNGAEGNNTAPLIYEFFNGPAISADGRYVAFESEASNLVAGDTNNVQDVFVHDRDTDHDGIFDEAGAISTTRVSVSANGTQGSVDAFGSALSADGRYVAFGWSDTCNPVNEADIFKHDRQTGQTREVSVTTQGTQSNGNSDSFAISGDGRVVAFASEADGLVSNDTNGFADIFTQEGPGVPNAIYPGFTIYSVKSGDWSDPNTWNTPPPYPWEPNQDDVVLIKSGHTVTRTGYISVIGLYNCGTLYVKNRDYFNMMGDFELSATRFITNYGSIIGRDGGLPDDWADQSEPGVGIELSGPRNGDGIPITNWGVIKAGDTGPSTNISFGLLDGGEVTIIGRNVANYGLIQGGEGGSFANVDGWTGWGTAGAGGDVHIRGNGWGRPGSVITGSIINEGVIRGGKGGEGLVFTPGPHDPPFNQDAGDGGNVHLIAEPHVLLGRGQVYGGSKGKVCFSNDIYGDPCDPGTDGKVVIEPNTISLAGNTTKIQGSDITIFGGDSWTLDLSNLSTTAISATEKLTLAVGSGGVIDLRGNSSQVLQAATGVHLAADTIQRDAGVSLNQLAGPNVTSTGSKVLRSVSLVSPVAGMGALNMASSLRVLLFNNGPEEDTFALTVTDAKGWPLQGLPPSRTLPGLSGEELLISITPLTTETNVITLTATSTNDPTVTTTESFHMSVALNVFLPIVMKR